MTSSWSFDSSFPAIKDRAETRQRFWYNSEKLFNINGSVDKMPEKGVSDMAKDLVCGMDLNKVTAVYTTEFEAKTYYFCSHRCMTMFKRIRGGTYLNPLQEISSMIQGQMLDG